MKLSAVCIPLLLVVMSASLVAQPATTILIPRGAAWSYLDDGTDPGPTWADVGFDDSVWDSGPAQLGYGDVDEATVVSYGGNPNSKHWTTYFRHTFNLTDPGSIQLLYLQLVRDDGAVVYLNGTEVGRSNMPLGIITTTTPAAASAVDSDEDVLWPFQPSAALLLPGPNVLAVEIHQRTQTSSDISFDLELNASTAPAIVTRGPYLQRGTSHSMTVRWRTLAASAGRLWVGTSPGVFDQVLDGLPSAVDHEVQVIGLSPETTYWYAVGTITDVLGGDVPDAFFTTAPPEGVGTPTRIWAIGDSGTANVDAALVRDVYDAWPGAADTDVWLMLGDNAYFDGKDREYGTAVFEMYEQRLRHCAVWPTRGNHENFGPAYKAMFTLPQAGEAGGVPSGSEGYYSFDRANVHFVCLNSDNNQNIPGSVMSTWLEADLAATTQDWIVAFWHHPPYSKGSHDSDTAQDMIRMRANMVPVLEAHGVDLVLSGHSHSYERSYLIDGHYGLSGTFGPSHQVDAGDGDPLGSGPYVKQLGAHSGTVYVVAGSSGKVSSSAALNHPAMVHAALELGSVVIDVDGGRMDVIFLDATGAEEDRFALEYPALLPWNDLGEGLAGSFGIPTLDGSGTLLPGSPFNLTVGNGPPLGSTSLVVGVSALFAPFKGGTLVPNNDLIVGLALDIDGVAALATTWPGGIPSGVSLWFQAWHSDAAGTSNWAASHAVMATVP